MFFSILLVILVACSGKESPRTLEVSFGALSASQASYVYGQKSDGSERFGRKISSDKLVIPLSSGSWKFQVISWSTSSPKSFEGDPVCGEAEAELASGSSTVVLNVATVNCKNTTWWGNAGYYESTSTIFYGLNLNICSPSATTAEVASFSDCPSFYSGVTGIKIVVPEIPSKINETTSECYTPSSANIFYTPAKIPFGMLASFPMHLNLKLYHGSASCTGADCCSGIEETYSFPRGFGHLPVGGTSAAPTSSSSIKLKLVKQPGNHLSVTAPSSMSYSGCQPFTVTLKDKSNTNIVAVANTTVTLDCAGRCSFHNNSTCEAAITDVTVSAGSPSASAYFKAEGYNVPLKASVTGYVPDQKIVSVTALFADIDSVYLFSATSMSELSSTYFSPPFTAPTTVVYETRDGNRGKMILNSVTTSSATDDTFDFDYVTYNSGGTIIASGNSQTITACFTGNCFLDLDTYPPVNSNTGSPFVDAWWENLTGSLYFNGQGSAAFMVLP